MKKCDKYEALFTFASDEDFQNHLQECADCKKNHDEMQKVSALVKEVKPLFKKQKQMTNLRVVASFAIIALAFTTITKITVNDNEDYVGWYLSNENYVAFEDTSEIANLGLPTDEYGLLYIE